MFCMKISLTGVQKRDFDAKRIVNRAKASFAIFVYLHIIRSANAIESIRTDMSFLYFLSFYNGMP